ncbi:glycoside hydrolase family 16 [Halothermothrix orenii H 168]|uniref:Glycoside hydrolase family 16 n=1 Tax=Halothermothrix orenii (strain H 168 / OCM 544 / DSM 9562) TaxID=373903 RepID=B8D159_HALOH|nr:family 16 glycosylhydrolase [Halothermothrix orenii]ACL69028.1 glycoside hydrolase family 16 [Halothermothrix orenii H 168]
MLRNKIVSVFLLLIISTAGVMATDDNVGQEKHQVPYDQLTLVWSDEFNYTGFPDPDKWSYDVGGHGWGNGEKQYYTEKRKENVWVEDGRLIIMARKEDYKGNKYTSARLVTRNKGDWLYGRIEVRAKLPRGRGTWPAIWMLPTGWIYGNWPSSGEIDIMEHVGYDMGVVHGSVHTRSYNHRLGTHKTNTIRVEEVDKKFHVYSIEWYPGKILFFVDNIHYFTFRNEGTGWREWPFDQPFHLILNIAVGGAWGGQKGIDDSIWPQSMEVDYVRGYDLNIEERDKIPPGKPGNLKADSTAIYVDLSWDHSVDNFGVKEYEIYLNDRLIGKTSNTKFKVKKLDPETKYNFKVRAVDFAGNVSEYSSVQVKTTSLPLKIIPGKVEAEEYLIMEDGIATETTTDAGGGVNLCYIGDGDWMEYVLEVQETGNYQVDFRVAGVIKGKVELRDEKGNTLASVEVPATGDWQKWVTVSSDKFTLAAGVYHIKVYATIGGFNLNWFEIKKVDQ